MDSKNGSGVPNIFEAVHKISVEREARQNEQSRDARFLRMLGIAPFDTREVRAVVRREAKQ